MAKASVTKTRKKTTVKIKKKKGSTRCPKCGKFM